MSSSDSTFETLALGFRDLIRVPGRFTAPKHYGQSVPEQKPRYQLKRTTPNRRERVEYRLQYGLQLKYDRQIFIGLILNDFVLRGISQRIEKLQKEMRISEKISDDRDEFEDHKVLRDLQKQYALQEHDLYISETRIPQLPLKQNYDLIRTNPTWYMSKSLIQDCKDHGGCCSRKCGCCAQRQRIRRKAAGHCTWECECCSGHRRYELSEDERIRAKPNFSERLQDPNPAYLLRMINAFFVKQATQ